MRPVAAILDTGFLFALANTRDRNHNRVREVSKNIDTELILPVSVFPEICYLIATRLGYPGMLQFS
ncbi:hypothetical protein QUF76_15510 [Desulfobacterales bacterium HSG16]|nr:hypothetical protein [Desulfobacterales bacterium HSG16]